MLSVRVLVLSAVVGTTSLLSGQVEKVGVTVAPGITLPASGTVFTVDTKDGKPDLVQLHASEVSLNPRVGSNFFRGQAFNGPRTTMEIKGAASAVTLHSSQPAFYVRLYGDDLEIVRNRVLLLRIYPEKDHRVVLAFSANLWGAQRKRIADDKPASKVDTTDPSWLKLTPSSVLEPGEYGVVFMPKDVSAGPEVVYDFTIPGTETKVKK
jgi:hypothetical protein